MQTLYRLYFDLAYRISKPRWDIDVPPRELKALIENGKVTRVEHGDGHAGRNVSRYWLERKSSLQGQGA
jgi:hypothetical protein